MTGTKRLPLQLGNYRLTELIGQGGMSRVYLANAPDGSEVAVKVVTSSSASQADDRLAILREIRTLSHMYHPGILRVLDAGYVRGADAEGAGGELPRGVPYMVSEYLAGSEFGAYLGRLQWPTLQTLLLALLDALGHAHGLEVVHRDLKPSNVIVTRAQGFERVKLADFGVSREFTREIGNSMRLSGTPLYMAPEQASGAWRDEGPWTDIYSLGVLAWHAACGQPPFESDNFMEVMTAHVRDELPGFSPVISVPPGFEQWLRTSLQKLPGNRFQTAASAALALADLSPEDSASLRSTASEPAVQEKVVPRDLARTVLDLQPDAVTFQLLRQGVRSKDAPTIPEPSLPADWRRPQDSAYEPGAVTSGLGVVAWRSVPVIGRDAERDELWAALGACRVEREPRGILLTGGPGIGKTKLTDWLLRRVREIGACDTLVFRGLHGKTASQSLAVAVEHHFQTMRLDRQKAFGRIHAALEGVGHTGQVAAYDAAALSELVTDDGDEDTVTESTTGSLFSPIARYLTACARQRQIVCVCEDVHLAEGLVGFFGALKARVQGPILFLATSRSGDGESRSPLVERREFTTIELEPLEESVSLTLVESVLGLEPTLARTVSRGCRGVPADALELIGYWAEQDRLRASEDGFVLEPGDARFDGDDPDSWGARISRVAERVSVPVEHLLPTLEAAAVLGSTFTVSVWSAVTEVAEEDLAAVIDEFVRTGLLHAVGDDSWMFAREEMREHLVESAKEHGRFASLHEACLRRLTGKQTDPDSQFQRGVHLRALGRMPEAFDAFEEVQRSALAGIDIDRARECVRAMGEILPVVEADAREMYRARFDLARVREWSAGGLLEEAERLARDVVARADAGGWPELAATGEVLRGDALRVLGRSAGAAEVHEDALQRCEERGFDSLAARCHEGLAAVFARSGRTAEVRRHSEAALAFHRERADDHGICRALFWYSVGWQLEAKLDEARDELFEAIEIARRRGFRFDLARLLNSQAELARLDGDLAETRRCLEEAAALHRSVGNERDAVIPELNVALVDIGRDEFESAHEVLLATAQGAQDAGDVARALFESMIVITAGWTGRYEEFDAAIGRCASLTSKTGIYLPELALQIERTGRNLISEEEGDRAQDALELAYTFYYNLGDAEGQEKVRTALDQLDP